MVNRFSPVVTSIICAAVLLLVDNSFLSGEDPMMLALDVHPNVEVRIFNPYQLRSDNMLVRYIDNLNDFGRTYGLFPIDSQM